MAEDLVPKLVDDILERFQEELRGDYDLNELYKVVKSGNATYHEAYLFSKRVGEILSKVLKEEITEDVLPDGRMYYNIANRVMNKVLKTDYEVILDYTTRVQQSLNDKANIRIKPQKPSINQDRIDGMVDRLSDEQKFVKISWMLDHPIVNFSQSIVDDSIRENVDFQSKSGYSCKVYRILHGKTCKWCSDRAGIWKYGELIDSGMVKEVFRRHENCDCEVYYDDGSGFLEDVHKKSLLKDSRGKFDKLVRKDYGLKEKNIDDYKKQFEREAKITEQNKFNDAVKRIERIAKEGDLHPDMDEEKKKSRINADEENRLLLENKAIMHYDLGIILRSNYDNQEGFRLKVLETHKFYAKYGVQTSEHFIRNLLGRINNGRIKSQVDVIRLLGKKPNYLDTETHNNVRYYNKLAIISDPDTNTLITAFDRSEEKIGWVKIYD